MRAFLGFLVYFRLVRVCIALNRKKIRGNWREMENLGKKERKCD